MLSPLDGSPPWNRMRGVELLQVLKRRSSGRLPVEHVAVCPGHVAVRLQLHQAKEAIQQGPVTIMFDLLPQERSQPCSPGCQSVSPERDKTSQRPKRADLIQFVLLMSQGRRRVPPPPGMLVVHHLPAPPEPWRKPAVTEAQRVRGKNISNENEVKGGSGSGDTARKSAAGTKADTDNLLDSAATACRCLPKTVQSWSPLVETFLGTWSLTSQSHPASPVRFICIEYDCSATVWEFIGHLQPQPQSPLSPSIPSSAMDDEPRWRLLQTFNFATAAAPTETSRGGSILPRPPLGHWSYVSQVSVSGDMILWAEDLRAIEDGVDSGDEGADSIAESTDNTLREGKCRVKARQLIFESEVSAGTGNTVNTEAIVVGIDVTVLPPAYVRILALFASDASFYSGSKAAPMPGSIASFIVTAGHPYHGTDHRSQAGARHEVHVCAVCKVSKRSAVLGLPWSLDASAWDNFGRSIDPCSSKGVQVRRNYTPAAAKKPQKGVSSESREGKAVHLLFAYHSQSLQLLVLECSTSHSCRWLRLFLVEWNTERDTRGESPLVYHLVSEFDADTPQVGESFDAFECCDFRAIHQYGVLVTRRRDRSTSLPHHTLSDLNSPPSLEGVFWCEVYELKTGILVGRSQVLSSCSIFPQQAGAMVSAADVSTASQRLGRLRAAHKPQVWLSSATRGSLFAGVLTPGHSLSLLSVPSARQRADPEGQNASIDTRPHARTSHQGAALINDDDAAIISKREASSSILRAMQAALGRHQRIIPPSGSSGFGQLENDELGPSLLMGMVPYLGNLLQQASMSYHSADEKRNSSYASAQPSDEAHRDFDASFLLLCRAERVSTHARGSSRSEPNEGAAYGNFELMCRLLYFERPDLLSLLIYSAEITVGRRAESIRQYSSNRSSSLAVAAAASVAAGKPPRAATAAAPTTLGEEAVIARCQSFAARALACLPPPPPPIAPVHDGPVTMAKDRSAAAGDGGEASKIPRIRDQGNYRHRSNDPSWDGFRSWAHVELLCFVGEFVAAAKTALSSRRWELCLDLLAGVTGRAFSERSALLWRQLVAIHGGPGWSTSPSPSGASTPAAFPLTAPSTRNAATPLVLSALLATPLGESDVPSAAHAAGRRVFEILHLHCAVQEPNVKREKQVLSLCPPPTPI